MREQEKHPAAAPARSGAANGWAGGGGRRSKKHTAEGGKGGGAAHRDTLKRIRYGTALTPLDQTAWFSFWSTRTSAVPIAFAANFLISLIARGARRLNPLRAKKRDGDG